jgi:hypothetical protein
MNATEANGFPPEIMADNQAIIEHLMSGKPLDPEVDRRIRERAERSTEELRKQHGVRSIAVDLIREIRDEE